MERLSPRQLEVVQHLTRGLSDCEIAHEMGLSIHTVRWHLREAKERTGLRSRTLLAVRVAVELDRPMA